MGGGTHESVEDLHERGVGIDKVDIVGKEREKVVLQREEREKKFN